MQGLLVKKKKRLKSPMPGKFQRFIVAFSSKIRTDLYSSEDSLISVFRAEGRLVNIAF